MGIFLVSNPTPTQTTSFPGCYPETGALRQFLYIKFISLLLVSFVLFLISESFNFLSFHRRKLRTYPARKFSVQSFAAEIQSNCAWQTVACAVLVRSVGLYFVMVTGCYVEFCIIKIKKYYFCRGMVASWLALWPQSWFDLWPLSLMPYQLTGRQSARFSICCFSVLRSTKWTTKRRQKGHKRQKRYEWFIRLGVFQQMTRDVIIRRIDVLAFKIKTKGFTPFYPINWFVRLTNGF